MNKIRGNKIQITGHVSVSMSTFCLFIVIYILQLDVMPLVSQDEVRYAEVAREMIATGNCVVPHLDGIHYLKNLY